MMGSDHTTALIQPADAGILSLLAYKPRSGMSQAEYDDWLELALETRLTFVDSIEFIRTFSRNGSEAFLAKVDGNLVLSVRGTEPSSFQDLANDIKGRNTDWHGIPVHGGFAQYTDNIFEPHEHIVGEHREEFIVPTLESDFKEAPITICGHSLGSASASLMAVRLAQLGFRVDRVYAFGRPKVGGDEWNAAVQRYVPGRIIRVVNSLDKFTRIYSQTLLYGQRHEDGPVIYIDRNGKVRVDVANRFEIFADRFVAGMESIWRVIKEQRFHVPESFTSHSMKTYAELMEQLRVL